MIILLAFLSVTATACPFSPKTATPLDRDLALLKKQSGRVGGNDAAEISKAINQHLDNSGWNVQPCADFSIPELNSVLKELFCHHAPELQEIYERVPMSHKKDGRVRRFSTIDEYENSWLQESELAADSESTHLLRDAKCAEVLMHWTHHVPAEAKNELVKKITLPTLPIAKPVEDSNAHVEAKKTYVAAFSCVTGHGMSSSHQSDHVWPHWPAEVHYHGMGHGAYPFWLGPSGKGGQGKIEVWYSEKILAERYYHAVCGMREAGYRTDAPCVHLFTGGQPNPTAHLYTATEDFCCLSGPPAGGRHKERLAPPATDFMDDMTYKGEIDFTGVYYKGKGKYYLLELPGSEPVTWFWYITDMDGKPVQQGEGGKNAQDDSGAGIQIYHDYNTTSFESVSLNASKFAIPSICKTTTKTCEFP